jgi:fructose 1,6-bisphosphate aldolase/phosphatase
MKVTLSAIKADVGSIGGRTRPAQRVVAEANRRVEPASGDLLIDGLVTYARAWDVAALIQNIDRFGTESVCSRCKPDEPTPSASATG